MYNTFGMRITRKLLFIIVLVLFTAMVAEAQSVSPTGSDPFVSSGKTFSIALPAAPNVHSSADEVFGAEDIEFFGWTTLEGKFSIVRGKFWKQISDDDQFLTFIQSIKDSAVKKSHGKITSEKNSTSGTYRSYEFHTSAESGITEIWRLYVSKADFFLLRAELETASKDSLQKATRIIDSFKILNQ